MSHAIIVNCKFIEEHLLSRRVPSQKLHVCYNGIDPKQFQRLSRPHPLTIGVVCALRPEKNLITLIDAFALVRKLAPELKLVIVGSGDELPILERRARETGVRDFCHFEPATARVREWLSVIDIFVLPSITEALSNSLMEAMVSGCCAVASDVGGNPELVRHGATGLLFRPGDVSNLAEALRSLIADGTLRRRMAKQGQDIISNKFSISRAAERMQEIYCDCLANRSLLAPHI
jgi:glycosyltransferase involved in cell wall biosynthesis